MAAGKGTKWTGDTHEALAVALWRMHGTVTPEQQEAVVKDMENSGFPISWEGSPIIHYHPLWPSQRLALIFITKFSVVISSLNTITMATSASPAKPVKKWDDTMLAHLFLSIYNTVDISFTPEDKAAIEKMMIEQFNHDVNWNGIR
ncbi:hypothetical protein F4859DRAFT_515093 [Xylaria cf. heliscus]|nr:hypothetical protein F4859DRAFT_515093 [Xylaria cf. heliscus]